MTPAKTASPAKATTRVASAAAKSTTAGVASSSVLSERSLRRERKSGRQQERAKRGANGIHIKSRIKRRQVERISVRHMAPSRAAED